MIELIALTGPIISGSKKLTENEAVLIVTKINTNENSGYGNLIGQDISGRITINKVLMMRARLQGEK